MANGNLGIEPEVLKAIYGQMTRIRAVDKAIQAGLSAGKFMFTYWPMTGQECIPATISQLTSERDYMVTTYRGIHDQVAKGVDLYGMFAEALGREGGLNKGKGGSPHISDPSSGSMLTTAIVGAGAPVAAAPLLDLLGKHPALQSRLVAVVRVGERPVDQVQVHIVEAQPREALVERRQRSKIPRQYLSCIGAHRRDDLPQIVAPLRCA